MNLSRLIKETCEKALLDAFPDLFSIREPNLVEITEATQNKFGHYQCNSAMKLSKRLGLKPRDIAEKWVISLQELNKNTPIFEKVEIAGPGFINFFLDPNFLSQCVNEVLHDPRLGVPLATLPLRVVIDFSAPNIAKEMHVGHLRSTIIGDCLARILTFLGHDVLRLNHVGDWGTQYGMLIAHVKSILPEITNEIPPNVTLSDLVKWYKDSKKRFDEDKDFKKSAQLEVVALQSGEETTKRAWSHIRAISQKAYQIIYDLLDIDIIERGESFYNPLLSPLVTELEQKGLITLSEGAKCMCLEGFTNREGEPLPLILQKSDGGFNYATTDMAALRHRVTEEGALWIIIVTDAGQSLHFQMVFEAAKKASFYDPAKVKLDHVPFGLVLNSEGKKFKTRSGETERLIDLLETAVDKAKQALTERNKEMTALELDTSAHILGIDAIKYADLSCNRTSDYIFSYDKMLRFEGNTAAFLLYAYVRIQSIQRKININIDTLLKSGVQISLEDPTEIDLGVRLLQFNEVIEQCVKELLPSRLTDYLYHLAEKFHVFFHHCRVEGSPQQNSRLLLCIAVANVLKQGLLLLGLKPLERM